MARHEGQVVFVRHALPGERVRAVVTQGRRGARFLRADAVEVLTASPDRVVPPCPYAGPGRCGGCDWQHATLEAQRRGKAAVVEEQLLRLAGIRRSVVVTALPEDGETEGAGLGWRTRMRFAVAPGARLGLYRHRSEHIVPVDRCRIAHPAIDATAVTTARWPGAQAVDVAVSAAYDDRLVVLDPAPAEPRRVRVPQLDPDVSVALTDAGTGARRIRGRRWVRERAAGRDWRVSAGSFWQVHPGAADALVDAVLELLAPLPGESALDLYSGVGLFAGAVADRVGEQGRVLAVESAARAVADARRNLHDLPVVQIVQAPVLDFLRRLCEPGADPTRAADRVDPGQPQRHPLDSVDLVVLDPPRAGAGREAAELITDLHPRAVAYVACDPAALARDVATFARRGYLLRELRAFDLFPMTAHVECVALLAPGPDAPG